MEERVLLPQAFFCFGHKLSMYADTLRLKCGGGGNLPTPSVGKPLHRSFNHEISFKNMSKFTHPTRIQKKEKMVHSFESLPTLH